MKLHRINAVVPVALAVLSLVGVWGCLMSPKASSLDRPGAQAQLSTPPVETLSQRPLSDFLSAQGSTSLFFPPFPDYVGWSNNGPQTRFALIDYTGLVAGYLASHGGPALGTEVSGTVLEQPLADGRAEVKVNLHVKRALSWACALPGDVTTNPALFGYRQGEILADASLTPSLSDGTLDVTFTNDAPGAPLPDLVNAFILGNATAGQELKFLKFHSSGTGPLRAASGADEGTPGRLHVTQSGIFVTHFQGATADGFPAEVVDLRTVGRGTATH